MTTAIASHLETLLDSPDSLIAWEKVTIDWQQRVQSAIVGNPPNYLIFPSSAENLAEIVQCTSEERSPILICGSGSKLAWGSRVKSPQLAISTQRLNRIVEHAVGDLTLTVEAGAKLAEVQKTLQKYNQFLPIDPSYPEEATIGGIFATADSGSWRQRYGGIRDLVLGMSFVRWDGKIAKGGGKVVKNVAGYDLMKLFTGSYGTLGIVTQVTFRLYPIPEASGTIAIAGEANAIATIAQTLLRSRLTPTAAEILSASVVEKLAMGEGMGLMVRFQSIAESVQEQLLQVEAIAKSLNLSIRCYQEESESNLWQQLQSSIRIPSTKDAITCKIGMMPNSAVTFLARLDELTSQKGLATINMSSGIGRLQLTTSQSLGWVKNLRSLAQEQRGFLTILEAPLKLKQQIEPWGVTGNSLPLMTKIKQQFDPYNLLNPGKFFS